MFVIFFSVDTL